MATSDAPLSVPNLTLAVARTRSQSPVLNDQAGYIAFDVPVIRHATTGGTMPVRLIRRRGSTGSLTVQLSATDWFRAQGVQSYAGESVTFADGEMIKVVNIPLNSITLDGEAHFILNVTITNALIPGVRWHELHTKVIVDDGSIYSSGKVLDDPTTQIIQDEAVDNSIVYLRAGTWDDYSVPGYVELYGNDGQKGTSFRDRQNIVIRNYPGENPIITCSAPWGSGLFTRSNKNVCFYGLEITGTGENSFLPVYIKQLTANSPDEYVYVFDCHIHHWYGGDNTGGIRNDDGWRCVSFNNKIHDGYDTRTTPGNPYTASPYGFHAGIHGYGNREFFVYQNTIYHVKRGLYRKQPSELGGMSPLFARNLVYSIEGSAADYEYAGSSDYASYDHAVFENICIGCSAAGLDFSTSNISADQITRALIYNNLVVDDGLFVVRDLTGIEVWNNLVIGGTAGSTIAMSLDGRSPGELTYCDFNGYEKDYRYLVGRNATLRSYDSFSAWQASDESQAADNQVPANPDANGAKGAPVFVGAGDYHLDPTDTLYRNQGRFALESIGAYRLGHEQIGATI
ncbi:MULTISPECIES: hypothetical protein [unclassified Marinobacter]|uniref:hypothetical protein n=1 Tax=unclassified Marinobacter TaxID=83889 RepID=UPI001926CF68|nr:MULTISPECIES: hypothetical protein [unclassified Marinobacter]MBL3825154.1 hypothetical protein [Marinobacter sp. MC3]MBL3893642.1 hypothetical protein [Marinobacter sp. MW3]